MELETSWIYVRNRRCIYYISRIWLPIQTANTYLKSARFTGSNSTNNIEILQKLTVLGRPGYRGGQWGHLARAPRSREGAPFPGGARQGAPLGSIFAVLNAPHGSARQCAPCGRLCASQTLPVGASCFKDYDSTLSATKVVAASAPYKLF